MIIEPPELSIIIPFYNQWEMTHNRLAELYKFAPDNCEVVLVDDCSNDESSKGIAWWQRYGNMRFKVRYYKNAENIGFGASCNVGVRLANGRVVLLLSNDVVVHGDVFSDILTMIGFDNTMLLAGRLVNFPGGWNEFDIDGRHLVVPYAEGWLLACTKKAWKELGGFDTRYGKFDYEDVDLSTTALEKNFSIVGLNSNKVHHLVGRTIATLGIDRQSITTGNRSIYLEKWRDKLCSILT